MCVCGTALVWTFVALTGGIGTAKHIFSRVLWSRLLSQPICDYLTACGPHVLSMCGIDGDDARSQHEWQYDVFHW